MKNKITYCFLLLVFVSFQMYSQESNCETILKDSEQLYEEGLLETVPTQLIKCLPGLTNESKIAAYSLLVHTYLYEDNRPEAKFYMKKLLTLKPEYQPTPLDKKEFIDLLNEYNNDPRLTLSAFVGSNLSSIEVLNVFGVHDINNAQFTPNYTQRFALDFGAAADVNLFHNAYLSGEFEYTQLTFDYDSELYDFSKLRFTERQDHIMARLNLVYYLGATMNRLRPSFKVGGSCGWLINSDSEFQREYLDLSQGIVSGSEENVGNTKNTLNYWANFSGGVNYRIGKHHVFVDVRYNMALNNMINNSKRFDNETVIHKYYFLDDDYKLNYLSVLAGFKYSFYSPKIKGDKRKKRK
ncbi:PorT family protein [Flavobacteriales bacterium]|nr:PorT family protein [Flavobacteriales bacterium]MDC3337896.1 PorT family protein [Flavobacteriales bacterium]